MRVLIPDANNGLVSRGRGRIPLNSGTGPSGPSLSLSASTIAENLAQGVTIATATPTNASNPGAISLSNIVPAGALQMNVDGVTIESGSTSVNFDDATGSVTFTASYTDDAGLHNFNRAFTITDVADGPTLTGAASTLATLLGTPTVNSLTTFDMRNAWVSPTGQTLTFAPSYGTIAGDGFTLNWTPTAQEFAAANGEAAFSVIATDEDGQTAIDVAYATMATVNTAPTLVAQDLEFLVPEGAAPTIISSNPADDATGVAVGTDPTLTADRDVLFGTGNVYTYSVTGAAIIETFDVTVDIGGGPGTLSIVDNVITIEPTSDFGASVEVALKWDLGALTNLGGIPIAANTSNTLFSFTTASGAAAPAQITAGQWSVADDATGLDITITINTLPNDGGSAITDLEYNLDGGSWSSLGGTTTGAYAATVPANGVSYAVRVRAVNAIGAGTSSPSKAVTATDVPAQFAPGDWSIADAATAGDATVTITTLAASNGAAITDIEAQIDGGAWTSLGISTATTANLAGFTDGVAANVAIRAVNAAGNGTASATKSVTTTAGSAGITEVGRAQVTGIINSLGTLDISGISMQDDDVILVHIAAASNADRSPSVTGYTELFDVYANDTHDTMNWGGYLRVSGTPPTSVPIVWGSSVSVSAVVATAIVLRGVDTTTLEDVTQLNNSGPNTALVSPGSITPSTVGAWIMTFAASAHNQGAATHTVTGGEYDTFNSYNGPDTSYDVTASIAIKEWASGAFAPTAWGFTGTDAATFSRGVITIAVRPA